MSRSDRVWSGIFVTKVQVATRVASRACRNPSLFFTTVYFSPSSRRASGESRTHNPHLRRVLLYPVELRKHWCSTAVVSQSGTVENVNNGRGLLIFDGDCGFCATSATWISSKWPSGRADIVAWQRMSLAQLGEIGLSETQVQTRAWWVDSRGAVGGECAIGEASRAAGGAWGLLGVIVASVPVQIFARPVYLLVARYRYLLPGGTPACRL